MSKIWIKNSKLVVKDGKLIICETCPCGAPCTCPCGGLWPPATWPCGGLLQTYVVSNGLVSTYDGDLILRHQDQGGGAWAEGRLIAPRTVTATNEGNTYATCIWRNGPTYDWTYETRTSTSTTWARNSQSTVWVSLYGCNWMVMVDAYLGYSCLNPDTTTPPGTYSGASSVWTFGAIVT
jgi:hypothetical protein